MTTLIARVAAAIDAEPDAERRAALEELAVGLLWLGIARSQSARLRALLCRLTLDGRLAGGDDDERDAAAA